MTTLTLVRNDTKFPLELTIKDFDGHVVDLTGYSTVKFKMWIDGASSSKISGNCTVTDAVNGACQYQFADGDLDTEGTYKAEVEVTYSSGKIITATGYTVKVLEDAP